MRTGRWAGTRTWPRRSTRSRPVRSTTITRFNWTGKFYQIERGSICTGLRGATVRIERRLDGSLAVRFRERYLVHQACAAPLKPVVVPKQSPGRILKTPKPSQAMRDSMKGLLQRPAPPLWKSSKIDRTRTSDKLN
jgi:hypothetical protein